jgi:hypothetical protein
MKVIERRNVDNMPLVTVLEFELYQKNVQQELTYSKFQFFVVNGIEHLTPSSENGDEKNDINVYNSIMKREQANSKDSMEHFLASQTLFKYLLSFRILIRTLSTTPNIANAIPLYNSSTFTRLLKDALGGNSFTVFLGILNNGSPHCKEVLEIARELRGVKQFPIANQDLVLGLLSKFRAELRMNQNSAPLSILPMNPGGAPLLGAMRGGPSNLGSGALKLNEEQVKELEKKILQSQLTHVDLQQQHNHLSGQYQQLKAQFKQVLEAKTEAHKKLIESEQVKLETGKALVEVRLSQQQLLKRVQVSEPELIELKKKHDLLFNEYATMKKSFMKMEQDYQKLELEHEELHVETLKLIQFRKENEKLKSKLLDIKIEYENQMDTLKTDAANLTKQKDVLFATNKSLRGEISELKDVTNRQRDEITTLQLQKTPTPAPLLKPTTPAVNPNLELRQQQLDAMQERLSAQEQLLAQKNITLQQERKALQDGQMLLQQAQMQLQQQEMALMVRQQQVSNQSVLANMAVQQPLIIPPPIQVQPQPQIIYQQQPQQQGYVQPQQQIQQPQQIVQPQQVVQAQPSKPSTPKPQTPKVQKPSTPVAPKPATPQPVVREPQPAPSNDAKKRSSGRERELQERLQQLQEKYDRETNTLKGYLKTLQERIDKLPDQQVQELERELIKYQTKALMDAEQISSLEQHIKASNQKYQKEIARLKRVLKKNNIVDSGEADETPSNQKLPAI